MEGNSASVIPSLAVIVLCGVIAFVLYTFMRGGSIGDIIHIRKKTTDKPRMPEHPGGTVVSTKLFVEQLDEDRETMIHRFPIGEIPRNGVSISRPGALYGTVKLRDTVHCAFTVSEEHARIGHDQSGFYIQEREGGSKNGMYLVDGTKVEEVEITEGLIIYLGEQPIRFTFPKRFATHVKSDKDPERPIQQTNIMRRRRT